MAASNIAKVADQEVCTDPLQHLAPFNRLRACLHWWEKHAPHFFLKLIQEGVEPTFQGHHFQCRVQKKDEKDIKLALEVMQEYVQAKAASEVSLEGTKYLVSWFVIQKLEPSGKVKNRLISDCRWISK